MNGVYTLATLTCMPGKRSEEKFGMGVDNGEHRAEFFEFASTVYSDTNNRGGLCNPCAKKGRERERNEKKVKC